MSPYLPFLEALGSYIRTAPLEHLRAQAHPIAAILATILPELPLRLTELAPSYSLPPEQALTLFQEMGLHGQVLAVKAQLEQLPARSSSRGARSLPAGLSSREVEVLCLVVAGKSNRQIAEELVLSEKTVANHLARIFAKRGSDNRTAAVAFAIRSGIA